MNLRTPRLHLLILVLCVIPAALMLATYAWDSSFSWEFLYRKNVPLSTTVKSYLGVVGLFGGIPLGMLSLLVGTVYLGDRFRHMNWAYRIAFVICDALTIAGMYAILSLWGFSR
jgi:hypothetical protein